MKCKMTIRAVNASDGEVIFAKTIEEDEWMSGILRAPDRAEMIQKLGIIMDRISDRLVIEMVRTLPVEGVVAAVQDGLVAINLGASTGVKPGYAFNVIRTGSVIRDPISGAVLSSSYNEIATVKITRVERLLSWAVVEYGIYGDISVGDKVVPTPQTEELIEQDLQATLTQEVR